MNFFIVSEIVINWRVVCLNDVCNPVMSRGLVFPVDQKMGTFGKSIPQMTSRVHRAINSIVGKMIESRGNKYS